MKAREDKAVIQLPCSNSSKSTVILTYFWGGYQTCVLAQKTFLPLIFPHLFTPFMLLSFITFYDNLNMHQSKEVFYFKLLPVNESTWCSFSRKKNNFWQLISKHCFADSAFTFTRLFFTSLFPPQANHPHLLLSPDTGAGPKFHQCWLSSACFQLHHAFGRWPERRTVNM